MLRTPRVNFPLYENGKPPFMKTPKQLRFISTLMVGLMLVSGMRNCIFFLSGLVSVTPRAPAFLLYKHSHINSFHLLYNQGSFWVTFQRRDEVNWGGGHLAAL